MATSKPGKWAFLKEKYTKLPLDAEQNDLIEGVLNSNAARGKDSLNSEVERLRAELVAAETALDSFVEDDFVPIRSLDNADLNKLYLKARDKKDVLNTELSALEVEISAYERLFDERLEEAGLTGLKFENGTSFNVSPRPYPRVIPEEKTEFIDWAIENRPEWLSVNFNTLKSAITSALEASEELPPHVDLFIKNSYTCSGRKTAIEGGEKKEVKQRAARKAEATPAVDNYEMPEFGSYHF